MKRLVPVAMLALLLVAPAVFCLAWWLPTPPPDRCPAVDGV